MKTLLLALGLVFSGTAINPAQSSLAPCTTATAACTEWVALGHGPARSLIYRTYSLDRSNDHIRRALIMIHGTLRNPDRYFQTATAAAFLAAALDDTVVIAPRIASADGGCHDTLAENEVSWSCGGDSWRSGGSSPTAKDLTSFDFIDAIVRKLADKRVFPNMSAIVIAGHSAGGQFVNRYEMANKIHETIGVPIEYVVANPSSYAWPDSTRPLAVNDGAPDSAKAEWKDESAQANYSYGAFDGSNCARYDKWPYGLEDRTGGYTAGMSDDQLKKQLAGRPTTYLLSQVDVLPLGGFDGSCSAMAQGATRRARGEAFVKFITDHLGAREAKVQIVSECGHNDRCVYTTPEVLPVIFPKPGAGNQ